MGSPRVQRDPATATRSRGRTAAARSRRRREAVGSRVPGSPSNGRAVADGALVARGDADAVRRTGQQARPAQPGPAHHAQAARRGDGRLRQAGLPRHPGQRRRRDRQDVTRHLLPVLLQQGGPAAGPGGRGGRRSPEGLRRASSTLPGRGWHAAVGGRARLGHRPTRSSGSATRRSSASWTDLATDRPRAGRHHPPHLLGHLGRPRQRRSVPTPRATIIDPDAAGMATLAMLDRFHYFREFVGPARSTTWRSRR